MSRPQLLTELDWQRWFDVSPGEAARLVCVQRILADAGIDYSPDTVIGMSRTVLADRRAPQRLRALADIWSLMPPPCAHAQSAWPDWPDAEPMGDVRRAARCGARRRRHGRGT